MSAVCYLCIRSFLNDEALQQHVRDSPAHAESFDCHDCNRSFRSEEALQQHLQDSPAHAKSFDCHDCDRAFRSEEALQQHLQDSPAHAKSFDCHDCDRAFRSDEALQQHLRESQSHFPAPETPLDMFFRSFTAFAYDPSQPPATSYACLQAHMNWQRGQAASADAWDRYQDALEEEVRLWYGEEDDIAAWHALCHAIGVEPPPQTCSQCEQAVRRTHVNIVDLIEWGRRRESNADKVQVFRNVAALRAYSLRTKKIFRNTVGERDSNVVLRHLLRKIFRGNL